MKPLLVSLAIVALGLGSMACASTSDHKDTSTESPLQESDGFVTPKSFDSDDAPVRFFGHEASPAERRAVTALMTRYYALAAKEDGAKACPLIASVIAERIPEEFDEQTAFRGKTCAIIMSKVFAQRHRQLLLQSSTLEVTSVRVEGNRALVLVRFAHAPVPNHIAVHREGSTWKIWELFDSRLP